MNKQVYNSDDRREILKQGKYLGYDYAIITLGRHPVAYVRVPKTHKMYEKDYDNLNISVNGGLTYSDTMVTGVEKQGWWLGWDYAHCNDFTMWSLHDEFSSGKKWSIDEIFNEVKTAIKQLKGM